MTKLSQDFYIRDDVIRIARDLLGKILVTRIDGQETAGRIVETEAYNGRTDKACHAYGNTRTNRTEIMYRAGGRAYVYLIYGIHHLFNVVTNTEDKADAVLIRAIEPLEGMDTMLKRRNMNQINPKLTSGPGKLSQAMGILTRDTDTLLSSDRIWIEDSPSIPDSSIVDSKRIGVDYAEEAKDFPWRFYLKNSDYISKK